MHGIHLRQLFRVLHLRAVLSGLVDSAKFRLPCAVQFRDLFLELVDDQLLAKKNWMSA